MEILGAHLCDTSQHLKLVLACMNSNCFKINFQNNPSVSLLRLVCDVILNLSVPSVLIQLIKEIGDNNLSYY